MSGFLGGVFEFLFKYPPLIFERGSFSFTATSGATLLGLLTVTLAAGAVVSLSWLRGRSRSSDRLFLTLLRASALLILLFCFLQPALVVPTAIPQENVLGILIDDSLSMRLADSGGETRSALVEELFGPEGSGLQEALADQFKLRFFGFSSTTRRIRDLSELTYAGQKTRLGQALDRVRQELTTAPLSGLVVITDGANDTEESLTEPLLALRARSVPIYTVGVGTERFERDVEIERIESPRKVLKGSTVTVDLLVSQNGYGGMAEVVVEESGRIVRTQEIELPDDGQTAPVRIHFTAEEPGAHTYRFRIAERPGEMILENNQRETLIEVVDGREKILYFEGEPRFELGFVNRALEDDENLRVVALQRTAEEKFLRLNIEEAGELVGGFPRTREELYKYKGIILGSIEADYFTNDQLLMISDFVSLRGGGLLMLGGRRSFSEGGFAGTPVADALPVVLEPVPAGAEREYLSELKVLPTPSGRSHAIARLLETEEANRERWETLPPLTSVNRLYRTKPGATTLLRGTTTDGSQSVVLAHQRFGRGRSIALGVQDTWLWQMHADIELEDESHEIFWRQLLRWLIGNAPDQITITSSPERPAPGETVTLTAEVDDERYIRVNDTDVVAYVTDPLGQTSALPLEWTVEEDGQYSGEFVATDAGRYDLRVEALEEGAPIAVSGSHLDATRYTGEYFGAEMRSSSLNRIADETGGRFYTPSTVDRLAEDVQYTESGSTVLEEKDLWDMPVIFLLLVAFISVEWFYRRFRGLK
jgi:uncharacterized membrane protein